MTSTSRYLSGLRGRLKRLLESHRLMRELQAIPAREYCGLMQDIRLSEGDLEVLGRSHPGPYDLLPQRLIRLGLDPGYTLHADRLIHHDLRRVCASCRSWRRCKRDLAKGDVEKGMRDYCLNAPTLDSLIVDRATG